MLFQKGGNNEPTEPSQPPAPVPMTAAVTSSSSDTEQGFSAWTIIHFILGLISIFMSFKCNKGFDLGHFLSACCCPYIYLPYIFAVRGSCGLF